MSPDQLVGLAINVGIYGALIAFVLYRQMSALPLRARALVLLPTVLGLLGLQQLSKQSLAGDWGSAALLVVGLVVGLAAGLWRGTTFRVWRDAGPVMVKGTGMTLVTWAVLIVVRLPFAFLGFTANHSQGLVASELLLALAVTFAAQNAVVLARAKRLTMDRPLARPTIQKR